MTQYEALQDKTVRVKGIKNRSYKKNDQLLVDRVVLKVEDREIPKGKITINPEVTETNIERKKVDGTEVENEIEEDRDPTVHEVMAEFPRIKELFSAVDDYGEIEIQGLIRAVRDTEDDEWNFFIRANELDKLKASKLPDNKEKIDEKIDEEFVEDQTSIDSNEEDESAEDSEKKSEEVDEDEDVIF